MSDLIDTTEMYLKTVYELEEAGIPALRARIVERLGQSGPTVSETVARLERDGLLKVGEHRHIEFTDAGFARAANVMRRHRLAERLLVDVIKLPLPKAHDEACRWEHVISDDVAEKISTLLNFPSTDPFGNTIPQQVDASGEKETATLREQLSVTAASDVSHTLTAALDAEAFRGRGRFVLERIGEQLQVYGDVLALFESVELLPGALVEAEIVGDPRDARVQLSTQAGAIVIAADLADGVYVRVAV
ncbi:MAG: metal-dependent transcriptional regulator [Actinomycetaceae bacterium]|nr:metal-dependent transcriptional regulator [Arcanobacterium sp.]MDD7504876.1 metal-dependent transcriptional regulator [Actinomycetaceae bacterium]